MEKKFRYSVYAYHSVMNPLRWAYRYIFRPSLYGAKVLIQCGDEFLFIRNAYGSGRWTMPGGMIEKKETPEEAMKREAMEEVGVEVNECAYIGFYTSERFFNKGGVHCYHAVVDSKELDIDPQEVAVAKWMKLKDLPKKNRGSAMGTVLALYKTHYGLK